MNEEMKIGQEQRMEINPLDYVTIPVTEYKKLIQETAKKELKKKYKKKIAEMEATKTQYYRWWQEEADKVRELRVNLDDAKELIKEKLGIDPDTERLAEFQFEKGIANEQSE